MSAVLNNLFSSTEILLQLSCSLMSSGGSLGNSASSQYLASLQVALYLIHIGYHVQSKAFSMTRNSRSVVFWCKVSFAAIYPGYK